MVAGRTVHRFLSDRKIPEDEGETRTEENKDDDPPERLWIIDPKGGEALPLYREKLSINSFAWASDSSALFLSVTEPLSKDAEEAEKRDWKDVVRWREQERGDALLRITIATALKGNQERRNAGQKPPQPAGSAVPYPAGAAVITHSKLQIAYMRPSPSGDRIAFITRSISHRLETPADFEIFLVPSTGGEATQITHNQALESNLQWSPDGKHIYLQVSAASGSLESKYTDVQGRLYSLDPATGAIERLGENFDGSWENYSLTTEGSVLAEGLKGTEQQIYSLDGKSISKEPTQPGSYGGLYIAPHSPRILFTYSRIDLPSEVYVASDPAHIADARPITSFNTLFTERAAPEWQPYTWKADDGSTVEGVLLYPPGKKGQKGLRMLTLIHGGPADADGNRFGADWYDWAGLAAARGWLVFRPNYRGSSGYGDKFMLEIMPHLVSRPGRDILEGVDALVKEGIADPNHLAIGGYSYGGYMTNWLITQTTRFKSAVTGAGAVEHAANWGNDDETYDDAWYLGGVPWQSAGIYQSEAALFQLNKVTTPTHLVGGDADIRVSYLEDVLLERALQNLGVQHSFLSFPGEGHGLGKNPWHGYVKVREELKWIEKYDRLQ